MKFLTQHIEFFFAILCGSGLEESCVVLVYKNPARFWFTRILCGPGLEESFVVLV